MDILFVSDDLRSIGLASRLVGEGHTVSLYTQKKLSPGYAFVTQVAHPFEAIKACKFIVADKITNPQIYQWAKTFNKPIIGCSAVTDLLNEDCVKEYEIAKKVGLPLPPTEVLKDVTEMFQKVLDWNPVRTVVRYDRETITCDHQQWMSWAIGTLPMNKQILLQTPVYGTEIFVTGWFDGLKWSRPFMLRANDANIKVSFMMALWQGKLDHLIEPLAPFLKAIDYHGPFTVKAIAHKGGFEVMSMNAGFEFPSVYAFFEGLKEPVGEFLNRIAFSVCEKHDITTDYMSSVVVGTALKKPEGVPVIGICDGNRKHLFFGAVSDNGNGTVMTEGPWVYIVTARGRHIDETFGRKYHTNKVVRIPEPTFMTHAVSVFKPWLTKLKSMELI
jgi:hypothetical protein